MSDEKVFLLKVTALLRTAGHTKSTWLASSIEIKHCDSIGYDPEITSLTVEEVTKDE